ncbi:DNA binding domain, excisionase family [Prevotella sp. oral taxon 472 str. F0295]|nr:helix-turn-helix domain-containing protein [Prevotella sp. oral taxon 472]EEX52042.1 DNA binding domain, excisionase family [Prevotella sp. oral taxon 472 str. F0295]
MEVNERLARIERLITIGSKNVFTTDEVALLLGISASRVRHLVCDREIPHYRRGNKVYFKKSEIEDWQLSQRVPTNEEINNMATTHVALNRM